MYDTARQGESQDAFRIAEKAYRKAPEKKSKNGNKTLNEANEKQPAPPHVVDVDASLQSTLFTALPIPSSHTYDISPSAKLYSFTNHPGFYLFRNAISQNTQQRIVIDAFKKFANQPACTNFNYIYGRCLDGIWDATQSGHYISVDLKQQNSNTQHNTSPPPSIWTSDTSSNIPASKLLKKLRWSSLGPVYDWTERIYLWDREYLPLPKYLADAALDLAAAAAHAHSLINNNETEIHADAAAQAVRPSFRPDAALVNFYYSGDTLCGHKDDAEIDLDQPLVSLSIGCPAVFLIGGSTKDVLPTAVLLRAGDAVVLSGPARQCYHGLPKVLVDSRDGVQHDIKVDTLPQSSTANGTAESCDLSTGFPLISQVEGYDEFREYMKTCRINVSIRGTGR